MTNINSPYRIVKKYYRGENQKVMTKYHVEKLHVNFWKSILFGIKWYEYVPVREINSYGGDIFKQDAVFQYPHEAVQYIKNLKEPVYADEIYPICTPQEENDI